LILGIGGAANAAVLNFSGSATVLLGDYPKGELRGGGVATINSSSGVIPGHINTLRLAQSRGQISGTFIRFVTDPDTIENGVSALFYDGVGGLTGTWGGTAAPISGGLASTSTGNVGVMPQGGIVRICIFFADCRLTLPLVLNQVTTVNGVPAGTKGVGVGGLITAGGFGAIRISLQAAPWTVKTATVIDQITVQKTPTVIQTFTEWIAKGWAHGAGSTTTSTAGISGQIQLVTPNQVITNLPRGTSRKMGSFVITVIHFIPEPGLLLLIGSGVAGLALLGRSRLRK
jgi:hypothetical protein